jgi:hypothetical protein
MTRTALDHPFVRDYLSRLDVALRGLPAPQARELRAQITAHLEDALPPDADNLEITQTLRQLGDPADVASEAKAAMAPTVGQAIRAAARRAWAAVAGARARTKIVAGLVVLLLAGAAAYTAVYQSAPLIQFAGSSGWWYPQDYNHEVDTTADGAQQTTVPIRSGQRQGFAIGIQNPSSFTETIIGPVTGVNVPFDNPNGPEPEQIDVSAPNRNINNGGFTRNIAFTSLPVSIAPHQTRLLRITWITNVCVEQGGTGPIIDSLYFQVRVGPFTRTDVIPLLQGWALAGPSHPQPTGSITVCG